MNISDILFMRDSYIVLPMQDQIYNWMLWLLPIFISCGVATAHFANEKVEKVLFNLISCFSLILAFEMCLNLSIDIGGKIGQKFISHNSKVLKDWINSNEKRSELFQNSKTSIDIDKNIILESIDALVSFLTSNWMLWVLFVLSIINTVAFVIVKTVYPILLGFSVIPLFYRIQRSLIIYVGFCFLLPVCIGCTLGIFDLILTDEYGQFNLFVQFGFGIAFLFSIGYSMRYVYSILAGDGVSQTVSSIGQNVATMGANWALGTIIAYTVSKPKELLARQTQNALVGARNMIGKKSINLGNSLGRGLEKNSITYGEISKLGVTSNLQSKGKSALGALSVMSPQEVKNIEDFSRNISSTDFHSGNSIFSANDYENWKLGQFGNRESNNQISSGSYLTETNKFNTHIADNSKFNTRPGGQGNNNISSSKSDIVNHKMTKANSLTDNSYFTGRPITSHLKGGKND